MRSLLAALALALAVPTTAAPAHACGGYGDLAPVRVDHVATGQVSHLRRNDAGALILFVSYPEIDGAFSGLYGIFAELRDDRMTRAFERDHARWSRANAGGWVPVTVVVERTGEDGAWRLVSYRRTR